MFFKTFLKTFAYIGYRYFVLFSSESFIVLVPAFTYVNESLRLNFCMEYEIMIEIDLSSHGYLAFQDHLFIKLSLSPWNLIFMSVRSLSSRCRGLFHTFYYSGNLHKYPSCNITLQKVSTSYGGRPVTFFCLGCWMSIESACQFL